MSHQKSNPSDHELSNKRTSAGVRFADVPEDSRHLVEWIEGCHSFHAQLPSLDDLPIPNVCIHRTDFGETIEESVLKKLYKPNVKNNHGD